MNNFEQTYLDIIFENNKNNKNNKNKDKNETYVKFSSYTFTAPDKKIVLVKEAQDNPEVDHFSKKKLLNEMFIKWMILIILLIMH